MADIHEINLPNPVNNRSAYEQVAEDDQTQALVAVKDFSFTYPDSRQPVIGKTNFSLYPGQVTLLLGRSGSGKTTLLRNLKPILAPQGKKSGRIIFLGRDMEELSPQETVAEIGFLFQNPEAQIVMETVYEELAFGLENIGLPAGEIQTRIADTVSFCGVEHLLDRRTADLSGGQKQLVNLCAILCLRPKLLLLDEPFSQLDPESVRRVVEILERLRRETSVAILMSEQRLEGVWSLADQVIRIEQGTISFVGSPRDFIAFGREQQDDFGLPLISKIFAKSGKELYHLPLTVQEGKSLLNAWGKSAIAAEAAHFLPVEREQLGEPVYRGKEISFAYPGEKKVLLKQISLTLHQGERLVICGGNGAGKTTLLRTMAGILKPLQGKWQLSKKGGAVSYLSQVCQHHFRYDTPHEEFLALDKGYRENENFLTIIKELGIDSFLEEDIYMLSAGQQQRVALAMVLAKPAAVYLLDEPTRGLDEENKEALIGILRGKANSGVIFATHDLEFAAAVGTSFTTLCHGTLTEVRSGADFFMDRYWQTTIGAKLFPAYAKQYGWYCAENMPKNWTDLLTDEKESG